MTKKVTSNILLTMVSSTFKTPFASDIPPP
uniref:Uncharacterized protein n=1 Tax=Arundo donax TaxID=35708 RepID=A0A0A9C8B2_ARUDO